MTIGQYQAVSKKMDGDQPPNFKNKKSSPNVPFFIIKIEISQHEKFRTKPPIPRMVSKTPTKT